MLLNPSGFNQAKWSQVQWNLSESRDDGNRTVCFSNESISDCLVVPSCSSSGSIISIIGKSCIKSDFSSLFRTELLPLHALFERASYHKIDEALMVINQW